MTLYPVLYFERKKVATILSVLKGGGAEFFCFAWVFEHLPINVIILANIT